MYEELNKKLVEFAGFKLTWMTYEYQGKLGSIPSIIDPNGKQYFGSLPNFTDLEWGIAYCFKWLVPKLNELPGGWDLCFTPWFKDHKYTVEVFGKNIIVGNNNPALALCLAIEKVI